jgi:alpha-1,2-mannosyltransferase
LWINQIFNLARLGPELGLTMVEPKRWRLPALAAALLVVALGATLMVYYLLAAIGAVASGDFQVYRGAVQAMLAGQDLYSFEIHLDGFTLPFTYPPFAALVMVPVALLPQNLAAVLEVLGQYLLLALLAYLVSRPTPMTARGWTIERILLLALGFVALGWSDPVMHSISLGQVSLALTALVLFDFVVVPPRWRGVLTGIAAAIMLVTRQWRQAANATGAAVAATALGFLVLPTESLRYWTSLLWQTDRVGDIAATRNKSLFGLLEHLGVDGQWQRPLWLVLVVVVTAVGLWQAYRRHRRGEELAAVLIIGILSTLISPISWPHHLVWLPLTGLYLVYRGSSWARVIGLLVLLTCWTMMPTISYLSTGVGWLDLIGDGVVVVATLLTVFGLPRPDTTDSEVS